MFSVSELCFFFFTTDARMGKKIEEQELDDFNVEPVGIVCRVCHVPPFEDLTAHLKSEMHEMKVSILSCLPPLSCLYHKP